MHYSVQYFQFLIEYLKEIMDFYLLLKNMSKKFSKNIIKNLSGKYSQKLLRHAKQYPTYAFYNFF